MGVISDGTTMLDAGEFQGIDVLSWDTTAKTTNFTAVAGNGYFVNTTSGAITVTLPLSPSAGDQVAVKDYAATSGTNNISIARNGSNISGEAGDVIIGVAGISVLFLYVDATQGWSQILTGENSAIREKYVAATGGTITTSGDYKIHKFTGPGTFTVTCAGTPLGSTQVDYMIVAGGGGSGDSHAGGGGGGGFRETPGSVSGSYTASPIAGSLSAFSVAATGYPVVVGAGGNAGTPPSKAGSPGSISSVFGNSSAGGGGSNPAEPSLASSGTPGGSGGGGAGIGTRSKTDGGQGNRPSTAPAQGNDGGNGAPYPKSGTGVGGGGGGGGATLRGFPATPEGAGPGTTGGNGGAGATTNISGSPLTFAGGGGGGGWGGSNSVGGAGGGGGGKGNSGNGIAGTVNTGGGGGGQGPGSNPSSANGAGGSGIVYIRYKFQ
jgi:hypothetical protein